MGMHVSHADALDTLAPRKAGGKAVQVPRRGPPLVQGDISPNQEMYLSRMVASYLRWVPWFRSPGEKDPLVIAESKLVCSLNSILILHLP